MQVAEPMMEGKRGRGQSKRILETSALKAMFWKKDGTVPRKSLRDMSIWVNLLNKPMEVGMKESKLLWRMILSSGKSTKNGKKKRNT